MHAERSRERRSGPDRRAEPARRRQRRVAARLGAPLRPALADPHGRRLPALRRRRRAARAAHAAAPRFGPLGGRGCAPRAHARRDAPAPRALPSTRPRSELRATQLRHALDEFDEAGAHAALDRLLSAFTLDTVLRDAVLPYLHELGERWQRGEASIGQEHFASVLLRGRLLGLARGWGSGGSRRALLACLPGEQHDLGLICFGLALRGHGWRITFLGPGHAARDDRRHAAAAGPRARRGSPRRIPRSSRAPQTASRRWPARRRSRSRAPARAPSSRRRSAPQYLADDPVTAAARISIAPAGLAGLLVARPALTGWSSTERTSPDGSVAVRAARERDATAGGAERARRAGARRALLARGRGRAPAGSCAPASRGRGRAAPARPLDAAALRRPADRRGRLRRALPLPDHRRPAGAQPGAARSRSRRWSRRRSSCARRSTGSSRAARLQRSALPPRAAARPHQRQPALLPAPDRGGAEMRVVVFGATGTIGAALVPVLAREHDVVAVSRQERPAARRRHVGARGRQRCRVGARRARGRRCRLLPRALAGLVRLRAPRSRGRRDGRARGLGGGPAPDRLPGRARRRLARPLAPPAQPHRDRRRAGLGQRARDDAARRHGRRQRQRGLRDDPRPRRSPAGHDLPALGLDADAADRARRRRRTTSRRSAAARSSSARRSTSAEPRS